METLEVIDQPRNETGNRYQYFDDKGEHLHTLDGRPLVGTSRIGNVLAKPLAWYGSGKAVEVFGCPDPKVLTKIKNKKASRKEIEDHINAIKMSLIQIKQMNHEEFASLIDKAYRAHDTYMRERAKGGTDVHGDCERFIKDEIVNASIPPYDYPDQILPFIDWSRKTVRRWLWSEGHCYSEKYRIGGISDAGYERKLDGTFGILDFKSSKEAYVSQFWQCAGYDIQISENGVFDKNGNMILMPSPKGISEYCIFTFGGVIPKPYFFSDPKGAKEAFLAMLLIYNKLPQD